MAYHLTATGARGECAVCSDRLDVARTSRGFYLPGTDTRGTREYDPAQRVFREEPREPDAWAHEDCAKEEEVWEDRPCTGCGWRKRTRVRYDWEMDAHGDVVRREVRWSTRDTCDACEAEASAQEHLRRARQMAAKARAIREKRGRVGSA